VTQQLKDIYGEVTVQQGDEHNYLGMILKYNSDQKTMTLNMRNYVQGILEQFGQDNNDEFVKIMNTSATDNLFQMRKKTEAIILTKH